MTRDDQDILIAEYTLGLLNPQEMAKAHALLGQDAEAVVLALDWERRFLELTDLLAPVDPSPLLLAKIQTSLGHDTTPRPSSLYRKPAHNPPGDPPAHNTFAKAPKKRKAEPATERIRNEPSLSAAPLTGRPSEPDAGDTPPPTRTDAAALPLKNTDSLSTPASGSAGNGAVPVAKNIHAATPLPAAPTAAAARAAPAKPAPHEKRARGNIWIWRAASVVFAAIALALGLMPAKPVPPPVTVVELAPTQAAILQAPGQSSTPGWTVTIDPQQNVLLDPQVRSDIPADASVQLWTHNKNLPQPRSLGLIDPNKPVTVPAALMGQVSPDQIFEMTLEPAGGSPTAAPTGPILFIGRVVTFGKRPPPPNPAAGASAPPGSGS